MRHRTKFCQNVNLDDAHEHLVVFSVDQNLVEFDEVVLQVSICFVLGLKKPTCAARSDLLNGEWQQQDPKRHILAQKHVI